MEIPDLGGSERRCRFYCSLFVMCRSGWSAGFDQRVDYWPPCQGQYCCFFSKLAPGKPWVVAGIAGVLAAVVILSFYTDVAGWVFAYIFRAATGVLDVPAAQTATVFEQLTSSAGSVLFWQWLVIVLATIIVGAGVSKGIERVTKRLMPVLFILLLVCNIRALTLPGAQAGLQFLFRPDFSSLTSSAILTALGLAFFKLSLGMGTMITYGSYMDEQANLPATAVKVALADIMISLMAGLAIFPAVFAFGYEPSAGPALLFITIPSVFASMPLGNVFTFLFFVLTAIASMGAILSLFETPVAYLSEKMGWSRRRAAMCVAACVIVAGLPAALSTNLTSELTLFGMTFFDFYDYLSSNILLPVGGLIIALFVGWGWGKKNVQAAISNQGQLANQRLGSLMIGLLRFVTPLAIAIILLDGLGLLQLAV